MNMHEILVATRNEIARRGHAKGVLQDDEGHVCLYGGFNLATYDDIVPSAVCYLEYHGRNLEYYGNASRFARALGFVGNNPQDHAVAWNNAPERTEEEVLARLDEAIARTAPVPVDPLEVPELAVA